MTEPDEIRCLVAACPEPLGDDKEWSFYLLNDDSRPLNRVVLKTFGHEWAIAGTPCTRTSKSRTSLAAPTC
jgi:hypothetical protein